MTSSIQTKLEWLQAQARKFKRTEADSKGWSLNTTEKELLGMINVQTGILESLNDELVQLRAQHEKEHETLCTFMAKEGFNYPDNNYNVKTD
jgi:hypothetical protein